MFVEFANIYRTQTFVDLQYHEIHMEIYTQ